MATRNTARVVTAADVQWSDGQKFDGYISVGVALPTGYSQVMLEDNDRRVRLPLWTPIPVRNGVVDPDTRLFFTSSLVPANCRYCAWWYDANRRLQASGPVSLFPVEADPYTIAVPSLTVPTVAAGCPVPEATPTGPSQVIITAGQSLPTIETPAGTINGSNAVFTLVNPPARLIVVKNGVTLKETIGYTLSGSTITFQSGYVPQTGDVLLAIYWV